MSPGSICTDQQMDTPDGRKEARKFAKSSLALKQTMDGFGWGKSHLEMEDDWGYPYFRKPPFLLVLNVGNEGMIHSNHEESQQPPFPSVPCVQHQ